MLKRFLLSGTALVALTTLAMAQAATPSGPAPSSPSMSAPATTGVDQPQSKDAPLFTNYKGADVLGSDGKSIGALTDVVVDGQGQIERLVISHGGVIGIGATLNAYAAQSLPPLNDGKIKLGLTTASLEALPAFAYPSGKGTAPAEGRASTSTSAPMGGPSPSATAPGAAATPPAAGQNAMNRAASGAADSAAGNTASNPAMSGMMWPVSYIVGADIQKGDKSVAISDARFADGKLSAVVVKDGTDLGLGKGQQQIAFNELSIAGTPKSPKITLTGGAGNMATSPSTGTTSAPSAAPPATTPTQPAPSSGGSMSH